jgi:hypothetical protein
VLESVSRSRREARRLVYLGLEPVSPDLVDERTADDVTDEDARGLVLEPDDERRDDVVGRRYARGS